MSTRTESLTSWLDASQARKAEQVEQHAADTRKSLAKARARLASVSALAAVKVSK